MFKIIINLFIFSKYHIWKSFVHYLFRSLSFFFCFRILANNFVAKQDSFSFVNVQLSFLWCFKNQYNCRTHFKSSSHFSFCETESFRILYFLKFGIITLKIFEKWPTFLLVESLYIVLVFEVRVSWESLVCKNIRIKIKFDASNISSSDSTLKVESLLPSSKNVNSFVVLQNVFVIVDMRGLNWTQIANNVSSIVCWMDARRMESMIISWGQIYHHKKKLISSLFHLINESCNRSVVRDYMLI
jgi:hypothetical protein